MKPIVFSLAMFGLSAFLPVQAQDLEQYVKKEYVNKQGDTLKYRMLYPKNYGEQKEYPIVLFLHGAGERGNDNEKQLTHGAELFLDKENREKYPALVVFPQCPKGDYWSSVKKGSSGKFEFSYSDKPGKALGLVLDLLQYLNKMEAVDRDRIYVMGLSMGGMGTFELLAREPKKFAAAIPICGGGNPADCEKYAEELPLWVFHGAKDRVVDVNYSRMMVNQLKELDANVKYTEYPEAGHNSWDQAFAEPDLLKWLFDQTRDKKK